MKDTIAIAYGSGLRTVTKADGKVGGEDSTVVVEKNMTNVRSEDD